VEFLPLRISKGGIRAGEEKEASASLLSWVRSSGLINSHFSFLEGTTRGKRGLLPSEFKKKIRLSSKTGAEKFVLLSGTTVSQRKKRGRP